MDELSAFGVRAPTGFESLIFDFTGSVPNNWLGKQIVSSAKRVIATRIPRNGSYDVERWGLKLRLHPRDNGCERSLLFTPHLYEQQELDQLLTLISQPRNGPFTFVDIGANVGLFSLFVAAHAPDSRALAIEPESGNYSRLVQNIAMNPGLNITAIQAALWSSETFVSVQLDHRDRGGSQTVIGGDGPSVRTTTLASVLLQHNFHYADAIKIDVEGAEDKILEPFFVETNIPLWPHLIIIEDAGNAWTSSPINLMMDRGYTLTTRTKQNAILIHSGTS